MDWSKVNWFAFFPQFLSIYLVFVSGLAGGYLASQVRRAVERGAIVQHQDFVRNMASGWAAQLGFMNAMFAALFSAISVWSASQSFTGVVVTLSVLVAIVIAMMWYLFKHEPDQIQSVAVGPRFRATPATLCKIVLLSVNVCLIVAIAIAQQMAP